MAKLTQFAVTQSGTLVYRSNGNVVRGTVETRTYPNGRIGVYRNGRLQGYVSKPTAKQQSVIDRKDKARVKRREKVATKSFLKQGIEIIEDYSYDKASTEWMDYARKKDTYYQYDLEWHIKTGDLMDKREKSLSNYAKALQQAVNDGVITIDQANERWEDMIYSETDKERSNVWNKLNKYFKEEGYKYLKED